MHVRWRGFELPSSVQVDRATLTDTYGRFVAEPFERGFGATVGNSLRRVLLSSLEGSAVTQIKIRGAQHEFTTIPGVREDVTEIVLNVKSLVVKNHSESTRVITVERNKAGVITGADVETDADVQIINRDHVLATLTSDVPFMMEMVVENGRGYVPATEHSSGDHEIGIIPIDAVYSLSSAFDTKLKRPALVKRPTTIDSFSKFGPTDLWALKWQWSKRPRSFESTSTIRPVRGVGSASPCCLARRPGSAEAHLENKLNMVVSELKLSVRANNCLEAAQIRTVRDLVQRTEDQLLEFRNFGETTLTEVREKLTALGLHLGMRLPSSQAMR